MKNISVFATSGMIALMINLSIFMIFIEFVEAYIASIFAFLFAVTFNFFFHSRFLWNAAVNFRRYRFFVTGYSASLFINVIFVYFFEAIFCHPVVSQIIGGCMGVIANYFVSKFSFTLTPR